MESSDQKIREEIKQEIKSFLSRYKIGPVTRDQIKAQLKTMMMELEADVQRNEFDPHQLDIIPLNEAARQMLSGGMW